MYDARDDRSEYSSSIMHRIMRDKSETGIHSYLLHHVTLLRALS